MAIFTSRDLKGRLDLPITNPKSLVITPPPAAAAFDEDSVDLRLGTHFLLPQIPPQPFMEPGATRNAHSYLHLHAPVGDYFVLPAFQTVLGTTLEFIKLPCDVSGEILTKSAVARTFLAIETAPWIHPNYRGCLTLEIANASNTAIVLYPGMAIGQLVLIKTTMSVEDSDAKNAVEKKLKGSFIGPIFPEAPCLKTPADLFSQLGVRKYRKPGVGWVDINSKSPL